jgi:pentatricopeptide repeat protein
MSSHPRTDLLQQAIDHHAAGRLEQAYGIYRQILARDLGRVDCHFRLGLLTTAIRRPDLALEHFEATVRLRAREARYRLHLGMTRDALGHAEATAACYRAALKLKAEYPQAHNNLANALARLGRFDEALRYYRNALTLDPAMPEAHNNLGHALNRLERPADAGAACRQALQKVTSVFRERLAAAFASAGLDAARYCRFVPPLPMARFGAVGRVADLFLDSIGWSGCNTTLEALANDLPVVTMAGDLMRGWHTAAILTMLGMPDMIAATPEEFIAKAIALGRDPAMRQACRARIARDKHRLYRDQAAVDGLARYLEEAAFGIGPVVG